MELIGWLARSVLAVAFVVAALAKARDRTGTRATVTAFGVPSRAAGAVAVGLPVLEMAAAVLLVIPATAVIGAGLACALLVVFTLAVVRLLRRGERPPCRCFGQVSSDPIGPATLVRNLGLLALGVVGLVQALAGVWLTPAGAVDRLGAVGVVAIAGLVVAAGLAAFCRQLLVQNGRILARLDELEARVAAGELDGGVGAASIDRESRVGRPAPAFTAADLEGRGWTLDELVEDRPLLLLFLAANCGPCDELLPDLERWVPELAERVSVRLVLSGDEHRSRHKVASGLGSYALFDPPDHISARFGAPGTPSAVLVDSRRQYASDVAAGRVGIEALLDTVRAIAPTRATAARFGSTGARVRPRRSAGNQVARRARVAELGGRVLVFWDPGCGWCERLLPDLLAREADRGVDEFVVVSTGTGAAVAALPFRSPVLIDEDRGVAGSFGVTGTPIAVGVDDHGRVSSGQAAGGPAVLELLSTTGADPVSAGRRS